MPSRKPSTAVKTIEGQLVASTEKRPPGRQSTFNPDTVTLICQRLSKGEPLAAICRDEWMPGLSTVYDWAAADPEVAGQIARAREDGEEAIAADCLSIADDAGEDYRMGEKSIFADTDHIQRSKLRIWTRLELLKRWNPKKWGDKQQIEHSGKIGLESLVAGEGE